MSGILVVQTAFLGDVVLTTPLLRELKRAHPEDTLSVVTTPVGAQVLDGLPFLDAVIPFDKRGATSGPFATLRLARRLCAVRPATVVLAQRSLRSGLLGFLSGARERIGFRDAAGSWTYTVRVPWIASQHSVLRYLALSVPLGGRPERANQAPEIAVSEAARRSAAALLRDAGVAEGEALLGIAPGSIWGTKRWTAEGFAGVARAARDLRLRPLLLGSDDERALAEQVAAGVPGAVVLAGRTSILELAAILSRCALLLANDSGPGHVAAAVGTPVITIFGPTVPAFGYAPFGGAHRIVEHATLDCRPCHRHGPAVCPLGHHRCMKEIAPEQVLQAIEEVLAAERMRDR